MKKSLLSLMAVVAAACSAVSPASESELLARNTVLAVYENTVEQPCRFMTADCPDRCDHATRAAIFRVIKNESYAKPGQYGDDKMEEGSIVHINTRKDEPGQAPAVRELISELKPGDRVRMTIHHNYIKDESAHYPARPVVQIERVPAAE
ncbi:MAG: hypothetical protein IJB31_07705 [Akkermansia sp.]|nr:hypothetical protein [Akkermansia sp.]